MALLKPCGDKMSSFRSRGLAAIAAAILAALATPSQAATDLFAVIKTGGASAALVSFDSNGENQGGPHLKYSSGDFQFGEIGDIAFGPDGALYAVIKTGGASAALVTFDSSGENQGGPHLKYSSGDFQFGEIGGIAFKPSVAPPAAVPEPSSWALFILGFGGAGFAVRRRRSRALALSA